ncbi:MAG TPA: hypothetical protein VFF16_17595 [Telluria sp.]|nr:hypothetical protein [Telluria sp.]
MGLLTAWRIHRLQRRSRYRAQLRSLPSGLLPYWSSSAPKEFPGLPTSPWFFMRACEGLMLFFDCAARRGRCCGLPSKAADSVWHAWTRFNAAGLDAFCVQHFGRAVPHLDAAAMPVPMDVALQNTRDAIEAISRRTPSDLALPALFILDSQLKVPGAPPLQKTKSDGGDCGTACGSACGSDGSASDDSGSDAGGDSSCGGDGGSCGGGGD